jgi:hypothetical protein
MPQWTVMTIFLLHHCLMFALVAALFLYPVGRILSRIGPSPLWSAFALIPFVNLIALWIVAFIGWPERV